jgi:hypothetical protein
MLWIHDLVKKIEQEPANRPRYESQLDQLTDHPDLHVSFAAAVALQHLAILP